MNPFSDHSREFESNFYAYPVISRRSGGLSLGINLSMRKECNFDCPYCQVDRLHILEKDREINLRKLEFELRGLIELFISGEIWKHKRFQNTLPEYRVLKDIALSGDGESTTSRFFEPVAHLVLELIQEYRTKALSIAPIVITNGTMIHKPQIQKVLLDMVEMGGGPWIKLDAGTEAEYQRVADTKIPFSRILDNLILFGRLAPLVIQMIQFYYSPNEISFSVDSMVERLLDLKKKGVLFNHIQLYTLARTTKIKDLQGLSLDELKNNALIIQNQTGILVRVYP
jgi:wyosine [tRNA(Phe)-imidazoG37] synthetase (radical SAM superfamily)